MRQRIIAGNWKMNGTVPETELLIRSLLTELKNSPNCVVVLCPPFTSLETANRLLAGSQLKLGAQDVSQYASGAYTGEVAAAMLLTLGVSHVIIGHSERRQYHAETDTLVQSKVVAALTAGLTPIICVGETLAERESDKTKTVIERQVKAASDGLSAEQLTRVVIAYEPVWAIGTGKTATPEMAQDVHAFIRKLLSSTNETIAKEIPILYGGSVKADNAEALLQEPDIDGALVGGASLKVNEFAAIVRAA